MKIYGDLNFESVGSLVQSGISIESPDSLPTSGVNPGRLAFVNQRLYVCASVTLGVPSWIELTDEVGAFVFTQVSASTTWNINHNLNSTTPAVQVYDTSGLQMLPDAVTIVDANNVTVSFGDAENGKAIVVASTTSGGGGGGGGGGGSSSLSALTSATAGNTLNNGNNQQVWNWALTSATAIGLALSESIASTGGSGSQYILELITRSGSTANPFGVSPGGNNSLTINTNGAFLVGASLVPGTSGQVLTSNGSSQAPSWTTINAGPFPVEKQTATSGQTVFDTSIVDTFADSGNTTYLEVFVNGVYQEQGASGSYTVTGANQVTFNYALSINSNVTFISFV